MSANVETAAFANTPAWHREGIVIDTNGKKGMTVPQALKASGLDWTVTKVPLFVDYGNGPQIEVEGRYGVQRQTDGKVFGTVGGAWEPVQNIEGFQIVEDLIQQAGGQDTKVWIESAMALDGGKKVVVMAHLDSGLQIAGEKYEDYLVFMNGHDGRTSVTAFSTMIRVVCSNTADWASDVASKAGRIVRVRHTKNAGERIQEAAAILNMRNLRAEELAKQGEWLVEQTISDADFVGFLESLMPVKEEDTPAATMIKDRRTQVADLYFDAPNLAPIRGTRWGALQAVAEYSDHTRSFKSTDAQVKAQLGVVPATLKSNAFMVLQDKKMRPINA